MCRFALGAAASGVWSCHKVVPYVIDSIALPKPPVVRGSVQKTVEQQDLIMMHGQRQHSGAAAHTEAQCAASHLSERGLTSGLTMYGC